MTIRRVKRTLTDSIKALAAEKQLFSRNPGKDNTRNRKLPFEKVVEAILSFQGGTLNRELMNFFDLDSASPTTSAFIQQRAKILPAAFESLFHHFTDRICEQKTYNGYRLFAVDGSDLQIAANPQDTDSFYPGTNGQKSYNLLHINAMYDLLQHIYVDAIIQKSRKTDESAALSSMVDRSEAKNVLLLADRGYEAYNNLAHIREKQCAKHMSHFGTHRGFRMFDCLEQLELFTACFLQLRRTLVDLIPDRLSFIVDKNCIILLFCTQIPAVTINFLLCSLKKLDNHVAVVHIGRCRFHRVNQSAVRIHADVLLVAEVPLVALFDGMSFRITLLFLVFRR